MRRIMKPIVLLAVTLVATVPLQPLRTLAALTASRGSGIVDEDATLPKDVYPDSRSRLPVINRDDLNEQGKKEYDAAAARSSSGRPEGVAAIQLHRSGV